MFSKSLFKHCKCCNKPIRKDGLECVTKCASECVSECANEYVDEYVTKDETILFCDIACAKYYCTHVEKIIPNYKKYNMSIVSNMIPKYAKALYQTFGCIQFEMLPDPNTMNINDYKKELRKIKLF